jgi:uncharacterized SAM-binding protein YcdF (DUF218 family)
VKHAQSQQKIVYSDQIEMSLRAMDSTVIDLAQQLWNYLRLNLPVEKADCIVGLGSYDLRVAERCAELYIGGWAPLIIFSGHLGNWTKRMWDRSEAEIFAEHAAARGVPRDKIWLETQSTNIGENVKFTRDLLVAQGLDLKSLIMVSKPSTERRMYATCQRIWPDMKTFFTSPRLNFADQLQYGIQDGLIHEMVGDIQRIKVYPTLGFQIPQDVPVGVWDAYERLVSMGFDKHLIGAG